MDRIDRRTRASSRFLAEALGSFVLVAAVVTGALVAASRPVDVAGIVVGVAAVSVGFLVAGATAGAGSGAHFNPAVTVGLAFSGRLPWREVPSYFSAQPIGAAAGAGMSSGFSLPIRRGRTVAT